MASQHLQGRQEAAPEPELLLKVWFGSSGAPEPHPRPTELKCVFLARSLQDVCVPLRLRSTPLTEINPWARRTQAFPCLCLRIPRLSWERKKKKKKALFFRIDGRFSGPFLKNYFKCCVWVLPPSSHSSICSLEKSSFSPVTC